VHCAEVRGIVPVLGDLLDARRDLELVPLDRGSAGT